jgi:hypothetical protein
MGRDATMKGADHDSHTALLPMTTVHGPTMPDRTDAVYAEEKQPWN